MDLTTDKRLIILKELIADESISDYKRFRCIELCLQILQDDRKWDMQEWFKELKAITDDVIKRKAL